MVQDLIANLNTFPPEIIFIIEFLALFSFLALMIRFFNLEGIYIFLIVTMILSNLQVTKLVQYGFYPHPIALGKIAICFSFLASDIIAECFGKSAALRGILLSFAGNLGFVFLMLITIGYEPAYGDEGVNLHEHLKIIFTPLPGVFFASILAFLTSQFLDVFIFVKLKKRLQGRYAWFRSFLSTGIASLLDNCIFYFAAFYLFNDFSVSFKTILFSYVLGTFIFRLLIASLSSFIIYPTKTLIARRGMRMKRM